MSRPCKIIFPPTFLCWDWPAFYMFRMLDEFGHEMENTESKMDSTVKKMAKVFRISNGWWHQLAFFNQLCWFEYFVADRRQWYAILVLSVIIFILIILFIILWSYSELSRHLGILVGISQSVFFIVQVTGPEPSRCATKIYYFLSTENTHLLWKKDTCCV